MRTCVCGVLVSCSCLPSNANVEKLDGVQLGTECGTIRDLTSIGQSSWNSGTMFGPWLDSLLLVLVSMD